MFLSTIFFGIYNIFGGNKCFCQHFFLFPKNMIKYLKTGQSVENQGPT